MTTKVVEAQRQETTLINAGQIKRIRVLNYILNGVSTHLILYLPSNLYFLSIRFTHNQYNGGLWAFFKFSWTRKLFFKALYEVLPRVNGKGDWQFMNYGYSPTEKEESTNKKPLKNKLQQHPLNMYHYLVCCASIRELNLLEVGSGRGGGANYIANNFQPKSIIGLDFSAAAIKLAKSMFNSPNLSYVEGNAMNLDFESNHFDVIINVESCHAYANQSVDNT